MKQIDVSVVSEAIKQMCIEACVKLPADIKNLLDAALESETWEPAKKQLQNLILNYQYAERSNSPICQDTGITCVFLEVGQELVFVGGSLEEAINKGVKEGYEDGCLRKSVVNDPLNRINTTTNTPALIYYDIVPGSSLKITVAPKGFGCENMSVIKMFKPTVGLQKIIEFIVGHIKEYAVNACPPLVIGVGIGGSFDKVAYIAKKAMLRPADIPNSSPYYEKIEQELLLQINDLGIGPAGFGGRTTALKVNVEALPTHIAGLPCAINVGCHAARYQQKIIN